MIYSYKKKFKQNRAYSFPRAQIIRLHNFNNSNFIIYFRFYQLH